MINQEPKYEVVDYKSLNKFLLGILPALRRKEIEVETAEAISKVSDKIIKNNLTNIMYQKLRGNTSSIDFFEPKESQVTIG
jgi:hypothetical protein